MKILKENNINRIIYQIIISIELKTHTNVKYIHIYIII